MAAATFFLDRAQEAIDAADEARTDDASSALFKEAETWLYMAGKCLNAEGRFERPQTLSHERRVARERRSFTREE